MKPRYQIGLIIIFVLGIYYPTLFAPFNSIDDYKMVDHLLNNKFQNIYDLFIPRGSGQYYRPLLMLTFIADSTFWGLQEGLMHMENIVLHLFSAILVFFIATYFIRDENERDSLIPLAASLLFACHPIATESVNWISGRTDVLAGFFVLATFLFFLQSLHFNSMFRAVLAAFCLLAGCFSKETALFFLPLMLLWCLFPPFDYTVRTPLRPRISYFALYTVAGFFYLGIRKIALSGGDKIVTTIADKGNQKVLHLTDISRVFTKTIGFYFKKLILPFPLNFGITHISPYYFWLGLLVFIGIIWCFYRKDVICYLLLAAFFLVSPALVVPLLKITWTPLAERYAYISCAPFAIAASLVFSRHIRPYLSEYTAILLVAFILGSAAIATAQRNIVWQDNITLFEDTLRKSPDFPAARNELAIALWKQGKKDSAYQLLLSNDGDAFQPSSLNKVRVYINKGDYEQAQMLLKGLPTSTDSLNLLIDLHEKRRQSGNLSKKEKELLDQSILQSLQKLLEMTGDPFYSYRSGIVQLRLKDSKAALISFEQAWQKSPQDSHYRGAAKKLAERLQQQQ